jgi:hypothetical protein
LALHDAHVSRRADTWRRHGLHLILPPRRTRGGMCYNSVIFGVICVICAIAYCFLGKVLTPGGDIDCIHYCHPGIRDKSVTTVLLFNYVLHVQ